MWLMHANKRRQIKVVNEEKQLLQQEKQIVVEFMHNMVEAVAEGSGREAMFQRIIHAAILSTGALSACIYEKTPQNTLKGIATEGLFPPQRKMRKPNAKTKQTRAEYLEQVLRSESFRMGEGLIGQVGKAKRALMIPDAESDPRVVQQEDPALRVRSIIVAPVLFQDELIAVLVVTNPADGLAFTETDFSLVESLAEQVGLAVHNSDAMQLQIEKNKIDLDIELASNIQGLLLPREFPPSQLIEFAAQYTPARKIGGDLYDIFALDADTIGVAVADVSGKGISASILMAICQTHLRHYAQGERSPSKVLSAINTMMEKTMRRDMFITIVYAVFDLKTGTVTLARAGHELPFFYDSQEDGTVNIGPIESPGMPVGMVPPAIFDATICDTQIQFGKNDALLLYTDGLTESVNSSGEEFSGARLLEVLHLNGGGSAQNLLDQTLESLSRFSGTCGQADDLTVIAIKHS
ncbi:MAG: sigma-B regulation protein RsbU (phosphoserine phosphatase) [Lentimonas sp.]|jgi:sigma-B regulation protein RsbU (phosphoserine phosphatase)